MKKEHNIVIIGGGAAGFFAAITAAERNPASNIVILEKGTSVLGKVKISGGGRCNVTNSCSDPKELIKYYPRGSKELLSPFYNFNSTDTIEWFNNHGVKLKTESDGRVFPVTDDSQTIVDCLIDSAKRCGIKILAHSGVTDISKSPEKDWIIRTTSEESSADSVIICTGSSNSIWNIISSLGHKIEPPVPSLFTFKISDKRLEGIQGVTVPS